MRNVHINISHLRVRLINKIIPNLTKLQIDNPEPIIQKRLMFGESTGIKRFYDVIRLLGGIIEVTCLRNSFNSYEGITVVGRETQVCLFEQLLNRIIDIIYKETSNAPAYPNMNMHLNEYRAKLRDKAVQLYIRLFKSIKAHKEDQVDNWYWTKDRLKRMEYIKTSSLKVKRVFRH